MSDISICSKAACGTRAEATAPQCPQCGSAMVASARIKMTGWIMTVVGGLIALPMAAITLKFLPAVLDPQAAVAEGRVALTVGQVPQAMLLLLTALIWGLSLLYFGLPRALNGKRHPLTKPVTLGFGALFLAAFFYMGSQLPDSARHSGPQPGSNDRNAAVSPAHKPNADQNPIDNAASSQLPMGLPLMKGATVKVISKNKATPTKGNESAILSSQDSVDEVYDFYASAFKDAGYKVQNEVEVGDIRNISGALDGARGMVTVKPERGQTTVMLVLNREKR